MTGQLLDFTVTCCALQGIKQCVELRVILIGCGGAGRAKGQNNGKRCQKGRQLVAQGVTHR